MPRHRLTVLLLASIVIAVPAGAATLGVAPIERKAPVKRVKAAIAPRIAEQPKPLLRLHEAGALGYEWKEWPTAAAKDARLRWRVSAFAATAPQSAAAVPAPMTEPISDLFDADRDRTQVMVMDTPWRRGGVMTLGLKVEF